MPWIRQSHISDLFLVRRSFSRDFLPRLDAISGFLSIAEDKNGFGLFVRSVHGFVEIDSVLLMGLNEN